MFNLETAAGWDALGAAWREAHANEEAAVEVYSEREGAALDEAKAIAKPVDVSSFEESQERDALIEAIKARHGVPEAETLQGAASDLACALEYDALAARAPTLAAFMLKLDMVSDPSGWGNFDTETWPLFLADVRRFAFLKNTCARSNQQ